MPEQPFRVPDTITLNVADSVTSEAESEDNQGSVKDDHMAFAPPGSAASVPSATTHDTAPVAAPIAAQQPALSSTRMVGKKKQELLDIISQPHANEEDWVAACHELERRGESVECNFRTRRRRRAVVWGSSAAIILGLIGAAAIFRAPAPPSPPVPSPPVIAQPVDPQAAVDYGPYMANLQREIKSHWNPPIAYVNQVVKVKFKVANDGTVSDVGFLKLSNSKAADDAASAAVQASTLEPLPPGAPRFVDIEFTFDYNVFKDKRHRQFLTR
ncbi:MAG: TonB family protein [Cyanobacteria bacterium REEB67]|nr:TonB family protein [Cyanobacteria bacterium REEB67]